MNYLLHVWYIPDFQKAASGYADVVAVLFIIATECLVGCGGIQHRLLPTSPSRHPKGCVCNHGLVLVSCELGSLSVYCSEFNCLQQYILYVTIYCVL